MLFIIVLNQFNKKVKKIGAARVRTWPARVNQTGGASHYGTVRFLSTVGAALVLT
jgi:hypothetical protein